MGTAWQAADIVAYRDWCAKEGFRVEEVTPTDYGFWVQHQDQENRQIRWFQIEGNNIESSSLVFRHVGEAEWHEPVWR